MASRTLIAVLACAGLILPGAAAGQGDPTLIQAYDSLSRGDYGAAVQLSNAYLASHPPAFQAGFIHAMGLCGLAAGSGLDELSALLGGYALNTTAQAQVVSGIAWCQPPPPPPSPQAEGSGGAATSALGSPPKPEPPSSPMPNLSSAAPGAPQPRQLEPMGQLVTGVSYSGDDYHSQTTASPAACAQLCRLQAPCRSMTYSYSSKTCWLKRSVPPAQQGSDFVSAAKIMQ